VVVACGAIESARLLLDSPSSGQPRGLGNDTDQVGRHLQGHVYAGATGLMPHAVEDGLGPGPSVAVSDFCHDNPGIVGGGLLSDDFVLLPIVAWRDHLPPGVERWGVEGGRSFHASYRRLLKITGPIQEIPNPESRVTLDPDVRDGLGRRVARLSGSVHAESVRSAEFLRLRAEEWLRASGAERVWSTPFAAANFLSAGQHQSGTCRMGDDPKSSVIDRWGRVHGHENLYVIDAAAHVTNGCVNPVLTVMALALRNAEALARAHGP
jgi:choline dehydrogenase-like flavoprotein